MGLHQWLEQLAALHEEAKEDKLTAERLVDYQRSLDEVGGIILAMQRLNLKKGEKPRRSVRVRLELDVALRISNGFTLRAKTLDVSVGGSAVRLSYAPAMGEPVEAVLTLPDGVALQLHGSVGAVIKERGDYRVSIVFGMLSQEMKAQLEFVVFDTVLRALKF